MRVNEVFMHRNMLYINPEVHFLNEQVRKLVCLEDGREGCTCMACKAYREGNNFDVLEIDVNDKEQTKVAAFRSNLSLFYSNSKNMSKNKVIKIERIDKLNESCQNALLIFIEEHNDAAFMLASAFDEDSVLDTVKSRMTIKRFNSNLPYAEFEKYCFSKCIGEAKLYFALTTGDISKVSSVGSQIALWKNIIQILPRKDEMKTMFKLLHLVKEKDNESFVERHPDLTEVLFNLMENIFFECIKVYNGETSYLVKDSDWNIQESLNNIFLIQAERKKLKRGFYKSNELVNFFIKLYSMYGC